MMTPEIVGLSGLGMMFLLGLRHGIDPDHLAVIDGLTLRAMSERPLIAPWIGTLFSIGHGLVVTTIAVGVGFISQKFEAPPALGIVVGWLPVLLLALVGLLNLWALLTHEEYQSVGWRHWLLPGKLKRSTHPLSVVAVGIVFGLVFDTATQAAAWGFVATAAGGTGLALATGIVFTIGMAITDTLDSRLLTTILRRAQRHQALQFRRALGWIIVLMSLGMAIYGALTRLTDMQLSDANSLILGIALFLFIGVTYAFALRRLRTTPSSTTPPIP